MAENEAEGRDPSREWPLTRWSLRLSYVIAAIALIVATAVPILALLRDDWSPGLWAVPLFWIIGCAMFAAVPYMMAVVVRDLPPSFVLGGLLPPMVGRALDVYFRLIVTLMPVLAQTAMLVSAIAFLICFLHA